MNKTDQTHTIIKWLAYGQSVYYLITGIWPLVHLPSFLWVTGPKTDIWLLQTVSLMITAIGLGLFQGVYSNTLTRSHASMAAFAAFSLAGIDIYYSSIGRIYKVYLLDAFPEIVLGLLWVVLYRKVGDHS